jgi:hypothetical protein
MFQLFRRKSAKELQFDAIQGRPGVQEPEFRQLRFHETPKMSLRDWLLDFAVSPDYFEVDPGREAASNHIGLVVPPWRLS